MLCAVTWPWLLFRCINVAVLFLSVTSGFVSDTRAQTQPTVTFSLSPDAVGESGSTVLTVAVSPPSASRFQLEIELTEPDHLGGGPSRRAEFADGASGSRLTLEFDPGNASKKVTINAVENSGVVWFANESQDRYLVGGRAELSIRGRVVVGSGVVPPDPVKLFIEDDEASAGHCHDGMRPVADLDGGSWVNSDRVELVFDRELQTGNAPAAVHFRLRAVGARVSHPRSKRVLIGFEQDETTRNPKKVQILLAEPVEHGQAFRAWYQPPTDSNGDIDPGHGALRDLGGNVACHLIGITLENRTPPRIELALTPNPVDENGGVSQVTARLARASISAFEVEVSARPVSPGQTGDFVVGASRTLRFEAGATRSTGNVSIRAVDNEEKGPARIEVTVSGTIASPPDDVLPPNDVTLVIVDDESSLVADGGLEAHVLRPWLARFGRAAASHAMEAVDDRLRRQPPSPNARLGGLPASMSVQTGESPFALLERSALSLPLAACGKVCAEAGTMGTAWGRGTVARFEGQEGPVSLDGRMRSFAVGMDGDWRSAQIGFALAHSMGEGSYDAGKDCFGAGCKGSLKSRLTAVHPYVLLGRDDSLSAWGMFGYGRGHTVVTERETGVRRRAPIAMRMGAFGARRTLKAAGEGAGLELALRSDALFMGVASSGTADLAGTDADVIRLRLALSAVNHFPLDEGRAFALSMSAGLRHDTGDADNGAGVEWSAGARYSDRRLGLTARGQVRSLALHRDTGFEEWAASGSLRLDPETKGRGFRLAVAPAWGTGPSLEGPSLRLLDAPGAAGRTATRPAARLDAELGYGWAAPGDRVVHSPYAGVSLRRRATAGFRIGWRIIGRPGASFAIEGTRHGRRAQGFGFAFRAGLRW